MTPKSKTTIARLMAAAEAADTAYTAACQAEYEADDARAARRSASAARSPAELATAAAVKTAAADYAAQLKKLERAMVPAVKASVRDVAATAERCGHTVTVQAVRMPPSVRLRLCDPAYPAGRVVFDLTPDHLDLAAPMVAAALAHLHPGLAGELT